ncbi:MAG: putative LPS assembly protein LptD [Bacteroidia bacterium]
MQRIILIVLCIIHFSGQLYGQEQSKSIPDSSRDRFQEQGPSLQPILTDSLNKPLLDSLGALEPDSLGLLQSDSVALGDSSLSDSTAVPMLERRPGDLEDPVKYQSSDSIVFDLRTRIVRLYGEAEVDYQNINLKAEYIEQNLESKEVLAIPGLDSAGNEIGKPRFKDGDQEFESRRMVYNFNTKQARISQMVTNEGDSYLIGKEVKLNADQTIYIRNTQYTTCSNTDHPHFYLNLYKAKIIPNKSIVSGPSNMVVEGIPVPLGLPFAIIPNQRGQRTGILPPEYGRSPELGFFLRNGGYYFAISDYMDLALRADLYSWGSFRINPSTNYVKRYKYNGNLSVSYSNQQRGDRLADDFRSTRDFFVTWQHQQDPKANPYGRFTASVRAGTSSFLANNAFSNTQFLDNQLNSSVSYNRSFPGKPFRFSMAARHNQNTQSGRVDITLPDGSFNVNRLEPFKRKVKIGQERWYEKIGFTYQTNFRSTLSGFDSTIFEGNILDKMNAGIQHSIPISTSAFVLAKYFQFTPSLNYNERWTFRRQERSYDPETQTVRTDTVEGFFRNYEYSFNMSMNTRIYGLKQFKSGKIAAIRHVINPRIGFSLRPDFSEERFGFFGEVQLDSTGRTQIYNRYAGFGYGGPGGGRQGALNLSVDNNLEAKIRQRTDSGTVMKKIKIFDSFSFATAYNMAADSLKLAPVNFSGRTTFTNNFSLLFGGVMDPYDRNENGQRINQFLINTDANKLANLTNANLTLSGSLRPKSKGGKAQRKPGQQLGNVPMAPPVDAAEAHEQEVMRRQYWDHFIDWTVPYNLSFNYTLSYTKAFLEGVSNTVSQAVTFNGDISLTPNWKIGYNSGYDFTLKRLTPTMVNLYRDLHCWEMSFNLVPFGSFRSYTFTLNAKAQMLQELKLTRRRDWYDLQRF